MLHHDTTSDASEYAYKPIEETEPVPTALPATSELVEDYLDRVCAPLVGKLPRFKRQEIRERVRGRIEQFAAAHRELGSTEDDAAELALAQCGDPLLISQRWLPEHTTQTLRGTSKLQTGLLERLTGSANWATAVSLVVFGVPYLAYISTLTEPWYRQYTDNWVPYYRIYMFAVPLLAGIVAGLAAKHKPVRGVVNAIAALSVPALFFPGLLYGLSYSEVLINNQTNVPWLSHIVANPFPALCGLVPWLALGTVGAGLGRRLRAGGSRGVSKVVRAWQSRRGSPATSRKLITIDRLAETD